MRDRRLELAGVALVLVAGGALWVLRHPEAPLVERASRWPVVGAVARAVRASYLPPPPAEPAPPPPAPEVEYVYLIESDGPTPGRPALDWPPRRERPAAEPAGAEVRHFPSYDATEPVGPLAALPADPRRLELARRGLGPGASRRALGDYELVTDLPAPEALIARWRPLVDASERAWAERYGVEPVGAPAETIVVYAREAAFAAYADAVGVGARDANGVAGWGIVALAAEERAPAELDAVFQHELAHLLTRRSVGPALPAWLAEGLAEDFGQAPVGADGRLDFTRVRGDVRRDGNRFEIRGGLAALDRAGRRTAAGDAPALDPLAATAEAEFAAGEAGLDRYADAFVWVRFLLAEPERARGFRAFLAAVRAGGEPSLAELDRRLPRPRATLAGELDRWLLELRRAELVAHGAPPGLPNARGVVFGETVTERPEG